MIDAVILDLGNVLAFHDNALLFSKMAEAFRTTPDEMKSRLDGGLWERVNRGQLPGDSLRLELNARLNGSLTADQWFSLWNCHFTLNEPMVRRVEQLINHVRVVLLSNTHDQHIAYLRPKLPVLEKFDGLVLSYETGLIKPEPGIYERAVELAKVPSDRCAFFDDVTAYAEAATKLGIHGRVFTTADEFVRQLSVLGVSLPG